MKINMMRKINLMLLGVILIALTACDIDKSINNSPNAINEAAVKSVSGIQGMSIALQVAAGDFYSGDRSRILSFWNWNMCAPDGLGRPQPVAWNSYAMEEDGPTDDAWKLAYRGVALANKIIEFVPLAEIKFDLTDDANNTKIKNSYLGMARAYKALFFGELTAMYGSIPINISGLTPSKFASTSEALAEVHKLLDDAITAFSNCTEIDRDLNYLGDGAKWIATCHTLKARYYLLQKNYAKALAETKSGISSNKNDLMAQYSLTLGEYSPWGHWTNTEVGEPIRGEASYVRALSADPKDTRLAAYFKPNDGTNYWGFAQHVKSANKNEDDPSKVVSLNKYGAYDALFPMASFNENLCIAAECKLLTNDATGAKTDLDAIRKLAGLAAYTGSDLAGEILNQKHLTLFLEGLTYYDMRRLGKLPETAVPVRWKYPASEKNGNPYVPGDNDNLIKDLLP